MSFAQIIASSCRPKHDKAVILACDEGYLPYAVCVVQMLMDLCPGRGFDIVICGTTSQALPAAIADADVRYCHIKLAPEIAEMEGGGYISSATYIRLGLPSAFADTYARILYLDTDIFVASSDLERLFEVDLKGKAFGAVRDSRQWRQPKRQAEEFQQLGLPPASYFNAGVLMIDTDAWIRQSVTEKTLSVHQKNGRRTFRSHDQSLLNIALYEDWAELSPVWNWQRSWKFDLLMLRAAPHIIHFIGPLKPWLDSPTMLPGIRRRFCAILARHYPDHPGAKAPETDKPISLRDFFQLCAKQLFTTRRIIKYLHRFQNDMTVHLPKER
ncbi:glycosyltransferase family 8 protein [Halovulum sp. GXIMD14793]